MFLDLSGCKPQRRDLQLRACAGPEAATGQQRTGGFSLG